MRWNYKLADAQFLSTRLVSVCVVSYHIVPVSKCGVLWMYSLPF